MMSKMSEIAMELDDQAIELGFESYEEALAKGYEVDYEKCKLVKRGLGYSETIEYLAKEQEKAHEAWLKERDEVLGELISVYNDIDAPRDLKKYIKHAIEFVKKKEV